MTRFIIEFGLGTDFHGQDVNKAAQKAVRDAMSRCCLCGLSEVLGISDFNKDVKVNVTVAVSKPEGVDLDAVKACLPIGEAEVGAVEGGLKVPGMYIPAFGDSDDSIEVAVAAIEVSVR